MASVTGSGSDDSPKKGSRRKQKVEERKTKVNVRCYTARNHFEDPDDFEEWISKESKKVPWYLCSSYKAGSTLKRIYACSFRKRAGYKKCERQLMVLFFPNGEVNVLDSSKSSEHLHYPIDANEDSRELRTVIVLRSPTEFSSWMAKQRERYAWHRRAGRRSFANIDYYQCASVGSDGTMCKRVMHVEYTAENGVIIKELENLPPHDDVPAHRKPFIGAMKQQKRYKRADSDSDYLPSTSSLKATGFRGRKSVFDDMSLDVKREAADGENKELEDEDEEMNGTAGRSAGTPIIEDFVIIPDEEYEMDGAQDTSTSASRGTQIKKEMLDNCDGNFKSSVLSGSSKSKFSRDVDSSNSLKRRSWKNGLQLDHDESRCNNTGSHSDPKYNLENFTEELANKLSKTPLERMAELRESVRREMDEVFAQQIVKEIISRAYSVEAQHEVLDRIREVLRLP